MKNVILALFFLLPLTASAQTARITIDTARVVSKIDSMIYGIFMEPIGFSGRRAAENGRAFNTLYGSVYNPKSPYANKDGFDTRYIDAARELKITQMRWPGGNYTSDYHWMNGIGPKAKRPKLKDLPWGYIDSNKVGTDEWVELNKAIGSENVVCINAGTGTLDEAAHWVEYCNLPPDSYYPDLRAKYGHPKPYDIKIWDLGNEVDGEPWIIGHKSAEDYVNFAREAAKIMTDADHGLKFVISGSSWYTPDGKWVDWNRKVITGLRNIASYVSIHGYWDNSKNYYDYMGRSAMDVERKITTTADIIATVRSKYMMAKPIYISFDEWGAFGNSLLPTLAMAQYFNSFINHADVVKMANYTLLTSILDRDKKGHLFKSPTFYTFKLFSNNCRGIAVNPLVQCDTFSPTSVETSPTDEGGSPERGKAGTSSYYGDIPYLDVSCVYRPGTKSLVINVVNRHEKKAVSTEIVSHSGPFAGEASVTVINSDNLYAPYKYADRGEYVPVPKEMTADGHEFACSFPAHSFTQIITKIK